MDVSIIIPTYNRLWSLPMAINSCRNTKCEVEIIVIDDGSTDGTKEWLDTQSDIIVITQKNWGKCWAVNNGFAMAKGKYVKFLDSDDMIEKNSLDEQFEIAVKSDCDVVVSGYKVINKDNEFLRSQKWIKCDDFIAQQLGECDSSHYSSYLLKKDFIIDIPHRPEYCFRDDRLFVLELAIKKPFVVVHEGTALLHRHHDGIRLQFNSGLSTTVQNYQHLKLYQKIMGELSDRSELNHRRIEAAINILWPLTHWIAKDNIRASKAVYDWIMQLDPSFKIPEKGFLGIMYNKLGFEITEKLLKVRRIFKTLIS